MIKNFCTLLLIFIFSGLQAQDCEIGELQIEILPCNNDGFYNVVLDFDVVNNTSLNFTLHGNGQDYGTFPYDSLPITLDIPFLGNGTNIYELVATDEVNVACTRAATFGPVNCNLNACHIFDLVVDTLDCTSNSTYAVLIDFSHDNVGAAGFNLYYNGSVWASYDYNELPLTITDLPVSTNIFDIIKVQDIISPDCFLAKDFKGLKCGLQDCNISNLTADVSPCDSTGHFYVTINFASSNTGSDGFRIKGNGTNYGTFDYADLPVTLGPFEANNAKHWEFVVNDVQNEACNESIQLGVLDCDDDCEIFEWDAIPLECTSDSTYALKINFQYNDYPDSIFWVYANGQYFGAYKINSLPITILNFPQDGSIIDTITICAPDTIPNCCHTKTFEGLTCPQTNCKINEIVITNIDCTSDSTYTGTIDFNHENTSGGGFDVWVNNSFMGTFSYSSLPLTIPNMPSNGTSGDLLKVCDHEFQDCCKAKEFNGPSCGTGTCHLYDLVVQTFDCTSDDTYKVIVNFQHEFTLGTGFDLYANGVFFGYYQYSQLPLTILNFPKSGGTHDWIKVQDNDNAGCFTSKEFPTVDCGNSNDCLITELVVIVGDCTSDDTYTITIDFDHANTTDKFDLFTENGTLFGTYLYSQLPLTINNYPKIGTGPNDAVKVCDHEKPDCCKGKEYASPNCGNTDPCLITELQITVGNCTTDDAYIITINFNHTNTTAKFDLFTENGTLFGTYFYSQLPLTIGNWPKIGTGPNDVVKVCDHEKPDCCKSKEYPSPDCGNTDPCTITDLQVIVGNCTSNNTYIITINFNHTNTTAKFDLFTENGALFGTYFYSQLPLTIGNYPKIGTGPNDLVKVCDHEKPDCCKSKEFLSPNCTPADPCLITELQVNVGDCTSDETYKITINFNHSSTSNKFDLYTENGVLFGTYLYSSLPLTINNYPKIGSGPNDAVKVCDHEKPDCCKTKEFASPDCGNSCSINNLQVTVGDCTSDNTYQITINFTPSQNSSQFDLYTEGGTLFGTYTYSLLPLTINNYPKIGTGPNDLVKVCDHEFSDCCKSIEYTSPNCDPDPCHLFDLVIDPVECTSPTAYKVIVNFQHQNTISNSFDLFANGVYFATYLYSQLPLTINNFPSNGTAGDLIKVRDHEQESCSTQKEFDGLDCGNPDCHIVELTTNVGDCTTDFTYVLTINFGVQNPGSDRFDLYANNAFFGTYFYTQLPLTISNFPVSGNTNDVVSVCDHELDDCCKVKEFTSPQCFSSGPIIYDVHVKVNNCITNTFQAEIDFEYDNIGSNGFKIEGNGTTYGNFNYAQLPVKLNGLPADDDTEYEFLISDNEFPSANDYYYLGRVGCVTSTSEPSPDKVTFTYYFDGENLIVKALEQDILSGINTYDIMGKLLQSNNSTSTQYVINTEQWVPGLYVLFVQGKEGKKSVLIAKPK